MGDQIWVPVLGSGSFLRMRHTAQHMPTRWVSYDGFSMALSFQENYKEVLYTFLLASARACKTSERSTRV